MKKPNPKKLIVGIVLLVVAYIAGSRALDTGSYWEYAGAFATLYFGIKFIVRAFRKNGKKV